MVRRGDVWWYEDPEGGGRPFLILTRDDAIPVLTQVMAVPATRTIRSIPTEVPLDESDGMPEPCVLTLDNVTTIRVSGCTEHITTLGIDRLHTVCEALCRATLC